jgi:hypothetical protein
VLLFHATELIRRSSSAMFETGTCLGSCVEATRLVASLCCCKEVAFGMTGGGGGREGELEATGAVETSDTAGIQMPEVCRFMFQLITTFS